MKLLRKTIIALVFATFVLGGLGLGNMVLAEEGDTFLTTTLGSYHFDRDTNYCETNPGIGVQYYFKDDAYITAGAYRNSPCNFAPYAMVGIETDTSKRIGAGIMGGLVGGYDSDEDFATAPVVAFPYVRFGSNEDKVHAKVIIVPGKDGLVGVTLNWKLK